MTETPGATDNGGAGPGLFDAVAAALEAGDAAAVRQLIAVRDPAGVADLMAQLGAEQRAALLVALGDRLDPEVLSNLDEALRDQVVGALGPDQLAGMIARLETDDALYLIEDLDEGRRRRILQAIPAALRRQLEEQLEFPEESAGRLMSREVVAVPEYWTVGACIDSMRESAELPDSFYDIIVVDARYRPIGTAGLDRLVRSQRPARVADIMERTPHSVPAEMDQEDVAHLFKLHDLTSAPVVDRAGRLLGTITVDDVVDVIEDEAEEDLMLLGGLGESDLHRTVAATARIRFPWLLINLGTAGIAATVISFFATTIEQVVALAVLMPVVASMGGNAGTQTLTVAVRALATRELTAANALRIVAKEMQVGGLNGVAFAAIAGLATWAFFASAVLGGVIAAAMVINLLVAATAGALIPVALARLKIDPAVASSVFLTTVTDVVGFFAFLGLAGLVLL